MMFLRENNKCGTLIEHTFKIYDLSSYGGFLFALKKFF